jgi:predicted membrane channel-forming protein YqfA (hemolysin III family)
MAHHDRPSRWSHLPGLQHRLPPHAPHERKYPNLNTEAYKTYLGLDFAGIGINMAFSPIPAFYYAMHCEPHIAMTYIVVIVIAGTLSFATCLSDWVHKQ